MDVCGIIRFNFDLYFHKIKSNATKQASYNQHDKGEFINIQIETGSNLYFTG